MLWLGTYTRIYEEKENLPPGGNLLKKYKIIQEFVTRGLQALTVTWVSETSH